MNHRSSLPPRNSIVTVTGINGFVGEHVAREFKRRGFRVVGVGNALEAELKVRDLIDKYISCDLLNKQQIADELDLSQSTALIHLAGLSQVGLSFEQPHKFMTENGLMTYNLLGKIKMDNAKCRVIVVSTGAVYDSHQDLPFSERAEINPTSPYAVGKLMAEQVVAYFRNLGLDAVVVRPFNHIGPGQGSGFILPDLYQQLLSAKKTQKLYVGNINTKRDYTDVRDIANAYATLALTPSLEHITYNICSGKSYSGEYILQKLIAITQSEGVEVILDKSKLRPNDAVDIRGDYSRIKEECGWIPQVSIDRTLEDFVNEKT